MFVGKAFIGTAGSRWGMSKRRKQAPMPASSAGLMVFYDEDTSKVKVRPEVIIALSIGLIVASIALLVI
jgi:preprotein translocase subunit Sec61beta